MRIEEPNIQDGCQKKKQNGRLFAAFLLILVSMWVYRFVLTIILFGFNYHHTNDNPFIIVRYKIIKRISEPNIQDGCQKHIKIPTIL